MDRLHLVVKRLLDDITSTNAYPYFNSLSNSNAVANGYANAITYGYTHRDADQYSISDITTVTNPATCFSYTQRW
jgi:hypothetical protein